MIPTKPNDVIWTDAQWRSIYAKGQDVLPLLPLVQVKLPY